ncbi:hypothetical protein N9L97_03450 [Cyclobacteriaceae bacterium]|jgi:hypothetical protein|nr:hypothetical protein [Cyclobacteriaceae bacterium]
MKNLRVVIFQIIILLVFMTACDDSSETINDMAKELKEYQVFQKNGFRDKKIKVSLSDQAALDLLIKINKLSKEMIILRLKSYGLEGVYRKKIKSLEKVFKKRGLSQIQLGEVTEKIEKTKSQLAEETKRLRSLRKLIDKNSINLKKMKRDFNKMDYVIKL